MNLTKYASAFSCKHHGNQMQVVWKNVNNANGDHLNMPRLSAAFAAHRSTIWLNHRRQRKNGEPLTELYSLMNTRTSQTRFADNQSFPVGIYWTSWMGHKSTRMQILTSMLILHLCFLLSIEILQLRDCKWGYIPRGGGKPIKKLQKKGYCLRQRSWVYSYE